MEVIIRDTDLHWLPTRAWAPRSQGHRGIIATVFGATGFLGRYLVQQLAKMESQVLVPFRGSEDNPRHLKLMGDLGQILPMKYDPRDENSIKAVIAKANVVINLISTQCLSSDNTNEINLNVGFVRLINLDNIGRKRV
ncbi:hypothetical protein E1A91_A10G201600v1 [Gossypium mustelinum]|uniref:3-beta hydroxysteroid dehydrogenase/isomerase domain-containing protein n=2 Tax=Gossypium TaxID=3633 RepID=A0A5D2XP14_GOSMU|nr:hypothetical protein E1A91_A10G201600v1 [Gossypium mustelinum]